MATMAVDFDSTIHDNYNPKSGMRMGLPLPGAVRAVRELKSMGNSIVIFTVRGDSKHVRDWLDYYQIPYDSVTNVKPPADVFIDDRAVGFRGNWEQTMLDVFELCPGVRRGVQP